MAMQATNPPAMAQCMMLRDLAYLSSICLAPSASVRRAPVFSAFITGPANIRFMRVVALPRAAKVLRNMMRGVLRV